MANPELAKLLEKRNKINEGELEPTMNAQGVSIYSENPNLNRRTIQNLEENFNFVSNSCKKSTLGVPELKQLFERLGCPQTHITLKQLIKESTKQENGGEISFREFLAIFKKACSDEIDENSPLKQLAALNEIDVGQKGVGGAKDFFQAKMKAASGDSSFAREVEIEKERREREEEEKQNKQENFQNIKAKFCAA